jgi:hypothetical protein
MLPEDDTSVETCSSVTVCEIIVALLVIVHNKIQVKGKGHPRTGHEGPEAK